jgi:diaminohydroxyphosphoribosylaminopyrimidine deaminase / 5-amino-6-(5-phosphoribosylamino)uracil reductase
MAAAIALAQRGVGRTGTNPSVGCIIVNQGRIVGRGWTHDGGRPHAEAAALEQAGELSQGADVYVTLEPCAHQSDRGPSCAHSLVSARPARVIIACTDPDPRTAGKGADMVSRAGIDVVTGVMADEASHGLAGFFSRINHSRPYVTIKLATSLDGAIAMADKQSKWITGHAARAHTHLERARCDAILVGAGTVRADIPTLDVRIAGLEAQSPRRIMLGSGSAPAGWDVIRTPEEIESLDLNHVLVEGGAQTAASFIRAELADRLILYRAPILIGGGLPCLGDIGLTRLGDAHGRWRLRDTRMFGMDRMEIYTAN